MNELVSIMEEIRDLLFVMNNKLDDISSDINAIKGDGLFDSLSDVCNKLDEINRDSLFDICSKLDTLELTCSLIE